MQITDFKVGDCVRINPSAIGTSLDDDYQYRLRSGCGDFMSIVFFVIKIRTTDGLISVRANSMADYDSQSEDHGYYFNLYPTELLHAELKLRPLVSRLLLTNAGKLEFQHEVSKWINREQGV